MLEMLSQFFRKRTNKMNIIYAEYNIDHNSIDIATTAGNLLRIDPSKERQHFRLSLLDYPSVKPDRAVNGGAKRRLFYR